MSKVKYFILTGDPGVGKTTLTKKISNSLREYGVKTLGFYTEEVRKNGVREGFDVVSLEGVRGRLAREQDLLDNPSKFTVGKYGVLIEEFEFVALPSLQKTEDSVSCLVIDEIGKMEFFSTPFKNRIKEIFTSGSDIVLATIPIRKSDPLIEFIRNNDRSKVWLITRENRNTVHEDIVKEIMNAFK